DKIKGLRLGLAEGGRAVLDCGDLVAGPAEALLEHPAKPVFVVGDENATFSHGCHSTVGFSGFARLGRWGPRPATSCSSVLGFARLGRRGPAPRRPAARPTSFRDGQEAGHGRAAPRLARDLYRALVFFDDAVAERQS